MYQLCRLDARQLWMLRHPPTLQGRRGAAVLARVEPAAAQLPYMVVPGNHEWHANFSHYK